MLYNKGKYFDTYCINCNKCKNKKQTCTYKTLQKIEVGEVVKNECIYHRLSENLDKKILLDRLTFSKLEQLRDLVYESLADYSNSQLQKLSSSITLEMQRYKNILCLSELLQLYYDVINVHLKYEYPSQEMIDFYLMLKDKLSEKDKKLVLLLLYKTRYGKHIIFNGWENVLNDCQHYFNNPLFFSVKIEEMVNNKNYLEIQNTIKLYNDQLNSYQKYTLYNQLAFIELNTGSYEKAYKTMEKCLKIINEYTDLNPIMLKKLYRQIGIVTFMLNKFDETIEYLQKAKSQVSDTLGIQSVLLYKSLEKTNQINLLIDIINSINISQLNNTIEKKITNYYKIKYLDNNLSKKRICELEEYICEEIKPIITMMGDLFKNIFLEDLLYYVSQTSNYKNFSYLKIITLSIITFYIITDAYFGIAF